MALVTVFGSVVLDLITQVHTLPGPGETVLTETYQFAPGGKGANQAVAACRAGASVRMVGAVGNDSFGEIALATLRSDGVNLDSVKNIENAPTGCATVAVDEMGENQIVVAAGANHQVTMNQLDRSSLQPSEITLMQLELSLDETWKAVKLVKGTEQTLVLNAAPYSPMPLDVLAAIDVLILNEIETMQLAQQLGMESRSMEKLVQEISTRLQNTVIVTLGKNGAICSATDHLYQINSIDVDVIDTVGAGDAFVGAFTAAMASSETLENCLKWGSVAGGLACTALGAQTASPLQSEIIPRLDSLAVEQIN